MNRRNFIAGATGLLMPTSTIFLPPRGGWPFKYDHISYVSHGGPDAVLLLGKGKLYIQGIYIGNIC